ncbi:MAG: DUF3592 domain-containing protein [Candidatus Sumerlaeaceae bacterium]
MFRYLISSFGFIFGAIWALVGSIFVAAGIGVLWSEYRIHQHGVSATGTVVEKLHTSSSESSSNYSIKYTFRDRSGNEHIATHKLPWETWRNYTDGDSLEVVYLPEEPDSVRLSSSVNRKWWVGGAAFAAFGGAFAGVGWFLVLRAMLITSQKLALLRTGFPVMGEIVEVRENQQVKINNRHPLYLVYRFTAPDGQVIEGKSVNIPRRAEGRFHVGGQVKIVYDPRNYNRHEVDLFGHRGR